MKTKHKSITFLAISMLFGGCSDLSSIKPNSSGHESLILLHELRGAKSDDKCKISFRLLDLESSIKSANQCPCDSGTLAAINNIQRPRDEVLKVCMLIESFYVMKASAASYYEKTHSNVESEAWARSTINGFSSKIEDGFNDWVNGDGATSISAFKSALSSVSSLDKSVLSIYHEVGNLSEFIDMCLVVANHESTNSAQVAPNKK